MSQDLKTTVSIQHVNFELFDKMRLDSTLILDQQGDTLLSAAAVRINITNWFFFKKNIDLKYGGLEGATIHLERSTADWNFQFLADYFSSGPQNKKESKPVNLNLKILNLKNVNAVIKDKWAGTDRTFSVKDLRLEADQLAPATGKVNITSLIIDNPVFSQYDYKGLKTEEAKDIIAHLATSSATEWIAFVKKVQITNGSLNILNDKGQNSVPDIFDENNIQISGLGLSFKNINFKENTLTSDVQIALKERSGFKINQLKTALKVTPHLIELAALNLQTPQSILTDYFSMSYESFGADFKDFIHSVELKGTFKDSKLNTADLAHFIPEVKKWNTLFSIDGQVSGTVDNLTIRDLALSDGGNNILRGNASLRGLPKIDESFMDLEIKDLRTTINRLSAIVPALKTVTQPNLAAFGNVEYRGNFTGYINDFVTFGNLSTSIGNLKTDLHLKIPANLPPVYSGKLSTVNFNLGKFINNTDLGVVAFNGQISGNGLTAETMDMDINGGIDRLEFNSYGYTNIIVQAKIRRDVFQGSASIDDPYIRIDTLEGVINFSDENPHSNFDAQIRNLDLRGLGFTQKDITLNGHFALDFQGKNIDNFLGSAKVTDAMLLSDGHQLSFDSLVIASSEFDGRKILSVRTNELEGHIDGNFNIMELPAAFQLFLNRYYPAYIQKPEKEIANQDFSFLIHARNISQFISIFVPNLTGFDESVVEGQINIARNSLSLDVKVPQFQYRSVNFTDIHLNGQGTKDTLGFYADIDDIITNDSIHSPGTRIETFASNDISDIHITTTPASTRYTANLSARLYTNRNGFTLSFNPSEFVLNQKRWTIQRGGEVSLDKKVILVNNLQLSQNEQKVKISSQTSLSRETNEINISLQDIVLEDVLAYVLKTPKLSGFMSGDIKLTNPLSHPIINFSTTLNRFFVEQDSIGVLKASGNFDGEARSFFVSVVSDNDPYRFTANLLHQTHDSTSSISGTVNFDRSGIHVLGNFMRGIASDINGFATGILNVSGTTDDPKVVGTIKLDSASMVVDYTQCRYQLAPQSVITFKEDEIDFGTLSLFDFRNKRATATGIIKHKFFDNFYLDRVHLVTQPDFQLLNTTAKDNNQFYGTVTGKAELTINGFSSDMHMDIKGEPTDSSHIFLPINNVAESGAVDYLDFIQYGEEMVVDKKVRESTNISLNMELTANPLVTIDVILDETTGDVIKARGSGKLLISVGTREPLSIRGRYTVDQGEYTFNFQTFLKTPFTLEEGFIEWQGDPYQAILNIDALYRARNVSLSNIPTSTGFSNATGDIDILFKLRGTLENPTPEFEFQFPFENPLKSDPIASEFLKTRFQSDNNEMLNQVASLLLFNTFLTTEQGPRAGFAAGNFAGKTVGQILSSQLTSSLNSWLQKLLKTKSINLYANINPADLTFRNGSLDEYQIRNIGSFSFKYTFPNNKFILNVGGNVNYNVNPGLSTSNSDLLLTPDISFEMLISPSGNLRVIGFNRSDFDPGNISNIASSNRTGIQLSYRKDFESFKDFFVGRGKDQD